MIRRTFLSSVVASFGGLTAWFAKPSPAKADAVSTKLFPDPFHDPYVQAYKFCSGFLVVRDDNGRRLVGEVIGFRAAESAPGLHTAAKAEALIHQITFSCREATVDFLQAMGNALTIKGRTLEFYGSSPEAVLLSLFTTPTQVPIKRVTVSHPLLTSFGSAINVLDKGAGVVVFDLPFIATAVKIEPVTAEDEAWLAQANKEMSEYISGMR